MATNTVAVLGTGIMGAAMARNLVRAGMDVRVWNRTRDKAAAITGASVGDAPLDAAAAADILLTMLHDADSVERAVSAEVLSALAGRAVWVQCTTVGVEGAERLARRAAEHGVPFVDAPVLGTRQPAEQGALVVLASGPQELRERVQPVFDAIGSRTLWVGQATEGSRLKIAVNAYVLALTTAVAETVTLAEALGVDPKLFLDAISGGSLDLPYTHLKAGMMMSGEFPASFKLASAEKDAALVVAAGERAGLDLRVAAAVHDQMRYALAQGYGAQDMAAVASAVWHTS